ncbi:hypothetical protein [Actinomyces sp. MRS3W]|uniref:hypothetical protein n=1 Tax=Actinomyces sp. MRS3W TaxID=2800796 RepID=UPI0028FDA183|nr:hypothetical protein [Actinomyces sp. MRS3W]MDU0347353.1 hypothetical protein [Actinomyces sp. MRS3W]
MTEQRADLEAGDSWAPIGWEPSDIGFDDAPFGSVLGDPLMGSPIFDVSVLDATPAATSSESPDADPAARLRQQAEGQQRGKGPDVKVPQQPVRQPSHRQSTTQRTTSRQTAPRQTSAATAGYGSVAPRQPAQGPVASGYGSMPSRYGATPPIGQRSAPSSGYGSALAAPQRPPRGPAAPGYGGVPAGAVPPGRPLPQPRQQSQNNDTDFIEKLMSNGFGWFIVILFIIIFANR